jgi:hypothetical protein
MRDAARGADPGTLYRGGNRRTRAAAGLHHRQLDGGDMHTVWHAGLDPTLAMLHQRALASRDARMRTVVVARVALKLSVLMSTPGGALLALPAAWTFVHQVPAELAKDTHNL